MGWAGEVKGFEGDYLMVVDANLNSLKSDLCIKRKLKYEVDLAPKNPQAVLSVTYNHTCRTRDWMTTNYNDWLRVFVPENDWLDNASVPYDQLLFENDLGKKVFGVPVYVEIGKEDTFVLRYNLPENLRNDNYNLFVQKQSGSGDVPIEISVKKTDGTVVEAKETLTEDKLFSF